MEKLETFLCEKNSIPKAVDFVNGVLCSESVGRKERTIAILNFESVLQGVIEKSEFSNEDFLVYVKKFFSRIKIIIKCRGQRITVGEIVSDIGSTELSAQNQDIIRNKTIPVLSENIKIQNRDGINKISLRVSKLKINRVLLNILCMVGGILVGLLIKAVFTESASIFIANEVIGTIITAFFNVLKMIIAPLVFFSIISGITGFKNTKEIGKISAKMLMYFIVFSIIGIFIGFFVYKIFSIGDESFLNVVSLNPEKAVEKVTAWGSFKNLILSIFPSNLLGAFVNNEILAVIFLAFLFGICIQKMQLDLSEKAIGVVSALNDLMCKLTVLVVCIMPCIVFCSMAKLIINVNFHFVLVFAKLLGVFGVGILVLFGIYCITLIINKISPVKFFQGFAPALFTAFTLASSSATMPVSLRCCTDNLKISNKISYFVVPLGATLNMNGSCIVLTVITLFTAKIYGVSPTPAMLISTFAMILLLSMAAPGVPGSNVIMLASILPLMGIPSEAAYLTICISAFIGMLIVPTNSTGDAIVAMLIHKKELENKADKKW